MRIVKKKLWVAIGIIGIILFTSACGQSAPPTATPTESSPTPEPAAESSVSTVPDFSADKEPWVFEQQTLAAGEGWIHLSVDFPEGWHINTDAPPFEAYWVTDGKTVQMELEKQVTRIADPTFPVSVPVTLLEGKAELTIQMQAYYCNDDQTLCTVERRALIAPITVSGGAEDDEMALVYTIVPPEIP